jgi:2-dehydro-3-deoxygalactonokinase
MTATPAMIGVDWGTSNFRAWLMDGRGQPLATVTSPEGLLKVPGHDFAAALQRACGVWLERWPDVPVLMCGMVGSRHGWREAPYLTGDAGADDLAGATLPIPATARDVRIVPGLQGLSLDGSPDVMRGEETQLVGAMVLGAPRDAMVCLPGTHSKWVELRAGRIGSITTFLTGEMFALLRGNSILTGLIETEGEVTHRVADAAFRAGLQMGQDGASLLHRLFSIRARALTGSGSGATADMLSGLLIGSELSALIPQLGGRPVVLIAAGAVADRYIAALRQHGLAPRVIDGDEACRAGLSAIAREVPAWRVPA